ncbi:N-acetyltransferase [Legionella taurinensis]|uniref:N-acetyltransferase n=1 Tax=Legionella taurinensis TaxID=70611 RepID=A0A3A5LFD9_9GAMM|nr:GNAT family protein [Legionella taurinensis]MDX1837016.1 GNAT family protein [Legionella taurinensis]PUT41422.1 N-acetyltransferase [Legionella taurinensis]PUT42661.1 N-acetyltransferase [Legionella taurinensis]PUT46689.1 N-acetyltransferase [Legionella taurinensis]PUT47338.1 N-acetyltransferase [Legionella taurinensis]
MNTLPLPFLQGRSLCLEPLLPTHGEGLRQAADDERIWTYMPMKAQGEFFEQWFLDNLNKQAEQTQLTYVIRRLKDGRILGSYSYYDIVPEHRRLEIGYGWLTPALWGGRANHEVLALMFAQAFEQWQFNRIQVATDPRNKRSYNNLKKLGATEEGVLRQHMIHHQGLITDTVVFSLLADDWPLIKTRLWGRLQTVAKIDSQNGRD